MTLPLSGHSFSVDKESRLTMSSFLRANEVYISDSVALEALLHKSKFPEPLNAVSVDLENPCVPFQLWGCPCTLLG